MPQPRNGSDGDEVAHEPRRLTRSATVAATAAIAAAVGFAQVSGLPGDRAPRPGPGAPAAQLVTGGTVPSRVLLDTGAVVPLDGLSLAVDEVTALVAVRGGVVGLVRPRGRRGPGRLFRLDHSTSEAVPLPGSAWHIVPGEADRGFVAVTSSGVRQAVDVRGTSGGPVWPAVTLPDRWPVLRGVTGGLLLQAGPSELVVWNLYTEREVRRVNASPVAAATQSTIVWADLSASSLHALDLVVGSTSVVPLPPGRGEVVAVVPRDGGQQVAVLRASGSGHELFVVTLDGARVEGVTSGAAPADAVRVLWVDAETLLLTRPDGGGRVADVWRIGAAPRLLVSRAYAGPAEPALVGPLYR